MSNSCESNTPPPLYEAAIFLVAVTHFPYPLESLHSVLGSFEQNDNGEIGYGEEFRFEAGRLLDEKLVATGCIELWRDLAQGISVTALFGLTRNTNPVTSQVLSDDQTVQGAYDVQHQTWRLWIGAV